nr:hypothetical protein [uncultured Campylobacter sp.]
MASKLSFDIVPYFNISDDNFSENNKFFEKDDSLKLKDAINASSKKNRRYRFKRQKEYRRYG